MQCVGCGAQVSSKDPVCNECGRGNPTAIRIFGIPVGPGLSVVLLLAAAYYFFG
jgi:hypothetical protein